MGTLTVMSGTPPDPVDAKLDHIFGQLTAINNRLNSHDSRLARVETGKPDPGKGGSGAGGEDAHCGSEDDTHGDRDGHREDRDEYDICGSKRDRL